MRITEPSSLLDCQTSRPCTSAHVLLDRHVRAEDMWLDVIIWMCVLGLQSRFCEADLCDWAGR